MPDPAAGQCAATAGAATDSARRPRLPDEEVRARLTRLEDLLALVEETPGPTAELAASAVSELAQVYGEALARAIDHAAASESPALLDALVGDELLGHLLVLHEIHPAPTQSRVAQAVEGLRPAVVEQGGQIALGGIDDGVATVNLTLGGCGSSGQGARQAVREAVLCAAPELTDVIIASSSPAAAPAFVPLATVGARTPEARGHAHAAGEAP